MCGYDWVEALTAVCAETQEWRPSSPAQLIPESGVARQSSPGCRSVHMSPPASRLHLPLLVIAAWILPPATGQCPEGRELTFVKMAGFSPVTPNPPPLLYSASYGAAITAECYNRCRSSSDCLGFVLDYSKSSCHRIPDVPGYRDKIEPNPAVNYFFKVCINLPDGCEERAWSLETTPGYELAGPADATYQNVTDKWECGQLCLNAKCSSLNYYPDTKSCSLTSRGRWSDPESFIPTIHTSSFYIENHCTDSEEDKCWHDPIYNQTSVRSDLQVNNITRQECMYRCGNETYFRCRGFSYLDEVGKRSSQCLLHSDTAGFSPLLMPPLVPTRSAIYVEAIRCVNLTVSCDEEAMTVSLTMAGFEGMLYSQGHSDTCYVQGRGEETTVLRIGLESSQAARCGVRIAYSIAAVNRTMVTGVVVVQRHQLIQTASDSVIRVSCILPSQGSQENLTLTTGFSVQEPGVQTEVTGSGVVSGPGGEVGKPSAQISVLDPRTGEEPKEIQLGDPVVLRIRVDPPYNASMVRAGHLIASSGTHTESLLLLDSRGCPPSLQLFPPLTVSNPQTLQAEFRAFRFPSSPVLALSLVLTFCPTVCRPVDCGNGITSVGKRKKRSVINSYQEIPLQLVLVIHSDGTESNSSSIYQASLGGDFGRSEENSGQICTSFLTASLFGLFWVLLQCCLLAGCCVFINRRQKDYADTISLRHDFQPRHVTWSDETDSVPSKGLRLTTPMRA